MNSAVFIDKDGTLIDDVPYNVNPALVNFCKGAFEALRHMQAMGFKLIIITNQSGLALNYFTDDEWQCCMQHIKACLQEKGIKIDGVYFCPHHPDGTQWPYNRSCYCRKPFPGMILKAAAEWEIDLSSSWMIGDILHDIEAGNRAGTNTILIDNGNETEWRIDSWRIPAYRAKDLREAANTIAAVNSLRYVE